MNVKGKPGQATKITLERLKKKGFAIDGTPTP